MTRKSVWCVLALALLALPACVSPFTEHAADVRSAWEAKLHSAHRRWDKYVLGLDWDDPYHEWHDARYASGPMHR